MCTVQCACAQAQSCVKYCTVYELMVVKNFFSRRYLLLTNSVTFSGLFGLGDFIEQQLERYKQKKKCKKLLRYDFSRTIRMITFGALLSPFIHFWYVTLDKVVVGKIHAAVFKKVLADETIMSPICAATFLGGKVSTSNYYFLLLS